MGALSALLSVQSSTSETDSAMYTCHSQTITPTPSHVQHSPVAGRCSPSTHPHIPISPPHPHPIPIAVHIAIPIHSLPVPIPPRRMHNSPHTHPAQLAPYPPRPPPPHPAPSLPHPAHPSYPVPTRHIPSHPIPNPNRTPPHPTCFRSPVSPRSAATTMATAMSRRLIRSAPSARTLSAVRRAIPRYWDSNRKMATDPKDGNRPHGRQAP